MASFPFQSLPYELQLSIARHALRTDRPIFITAALPHTLSTAADAHLTPASAHRTSPQRGCEPFDLNPLAHSAATSASSSEPPLLPTAADERALAALCRPFHDAVRHYRYSDRAFDFASRHALRLFAERLGAPRAALVTSVGFALAAHPYGPFVYRDLAGAFPRLECLRLAIPPHMSGNRAQIAAEIEQTARQCGRLRRVEVVRESCWGNGNLAWAEEMMESANRWLERRWRIERRRSAYLPPDGEGEIDWDLGPLYPPEAEEAAETATSEDSINQVIQNALAQNHRVQAAIAGASSFHSSSTAASSVHAYNDAVMSLAAPSPSASDMPSDDNAELPDAPPPAPFDDDAFDDAPRSDTLVSEPAIPSPPLDMDTDANASPDGGPSLPEALRARLDRTPPLMGSPSTVDSCCYCSTPSSSAASPVLSGRKCRCTKRRDTPGPTVQGRRSCGR